MSATEKHRQKRRAERLQTETVRDATKTNPSSLRLPVDVTSNYNGYEDVVVEKPPRESEEVEAASEQVEQKKKKSIINMRTTTIAVAFISSVAYIASTVPFDFNL